MNTTCNLLQEALTWVEANYPQSIKLQSNGDKFESMGNFLTLEYLLNQLTTEYQSIYLIKYNQLLFQLTGNIINQISILLTNYLKK